MFFWRGLFFFGELWSGAGSTFFPSFLRGLLKGVLEYGLLALPSPLYLLFKLTVLSIVSSVCSGVIWIVKAGAVYLFLGDLLV